MDIESRVASELEDAQRFQGFRSRVLGATIDPVLEELDALLLVAFRNGGSAAAREAAGHAFGLTRTDEGGAVA